MFGLKIFVRVQTFRRVPPVLPRNFCHPVMRMDQLLANEHPDGQAACKWSSRWTALLQMIIRMDRPLANDHPDRPAFCKWSSGWTNLLQMIIRMDQPLANDPHFPYLFSSPPKKYIFPLQIQSSFSICLIFPQQNISLSKYYPSIPSLLIFSSKEPKL